MTVTAYFRGHQARWDEEREEWFYLDDNSPVANNDRPCAKCGEPPTPEGYDACLCYLPGAWSACCGHGVEEPYVKFGEEPD